VRGPTTLWHISAHLSWRWITALEENLTEALKSGRAVESLVVDRDGRVVIGPRSLAGKIVDLPGDRAAGAVGRLVHRWADGEEYVSGYAVSDGAGTFPGLGWTVWVREPTSTAFAAARELEHQIFAGLLLLGLIGAVIGIASTARRMRGLAAIARSADAIRLGQATALAAEGVDGRAHRHSLHARRRAAARACVAAGSERGAGRARRRARARGRADERGEQVRGRGARAAAHGARPARHARALDDGAAHRDPAPAPARRPNPARCGRSWPARRRLPWRACARRARRSRRSGTTQSATSGSAPRSRSCSSASRTARGFRSRSTATGAPMR
jgi:hypothetical protein